MKTCHQSIWLVILGCLFLDSTPLVRGGTDQILVAQAYRGRAVVLKGTALGTSLDISDTGALPASGGRKDNTLSHSQLNGLYTLDVATAYTQGEKDQTISEASATRLQLNVAGNSIIADVITATAEVMCCTNVPEYSLDSRIVGLKINGQSVIVTGAASQIISLPVGRVILNEQSVVVGNNSVDVSVNALHVVIEGVADLIVSRAAAGITCTEPTVTPPPPPPPPAPPGPPEPPSPPPPTTPPQEEPCPDTVRGNGWIAPEGQKSDFAYCVKLDRKGTLKGNLRFKDKVKQVRVKCKKVRNHIKLDEVTRAIEYEGLINNAPGIALVIVSDNSAVGLEDTFEIVLSIGYHAFGDLGATQPGGGNNRLQPR